MDYKIQSSTLRCARTGQELKPGDKFFSVLYDRGSVLEREDISVTAWQGPPPEAFSFWMGRVPREPSKRIQVDDDVLFDCFLRLTDAEEEQKVNFRYIVALLLMRRRRLKFEEVRFENERELLSLRCTRTRNLYEVVNPRLTEQQIAEVQEQVLKVVGTT